MAKTPVKSPNKNTNITKPTRKYGWKPDIPDIRDLKYTDIKKKLAKLPPKVDLSESMPPIRDQGDLGSCTAFSIGTILHYLRLKTKETPDFVPSALFIYYNERAVEGTINEDAGAVIRTGIYNCNHIGFCDDKHWPYDLTKWKKKPTATAYNNATLYKALRYYRIDNRKLDHLKHCLAAGYPFVFGFTVYDSSFAADTNKGKIPMPKPTDYVEGGHAVVCCGYDDVTKLFKIHNSWGTSVGDKGYYYMPYEYLTNAELSDDFWTIRLIQETDGI